MLFVLIIEFFWHLFKFYALGKCLIHPTLVLALLITVWGRHYPDDIREKEISVQEY